jgi:beta-glucosidase
VLEVNPRTVVVVNAGSPVEMPWASRAGAVLMTWYPGEEGADALADMLVGVAEPSGRLPVTFPARVEDGPAGSGVEGDRYPGIEGKVVYGEGVLVGYRFYETTRLAPLFPFGFGLSYGDMALEDVRTGDGDGDGNGGIEVQVTVVNNGTRQGTEVVQVYVRAPESLVRRPDRELVGFAKVTVDAGGRETVRVPLGAEAFRYWDVDAHAWRADPGRYELLVGKSSHDIWASTEVMWEGAPAS